MGIKLKWRDRNTAEEGHKVYRSTSPMDPNAPADPNWTSVVLLAKFDGANGATSSADAAGKVLTFVGNAQLDTSQQRFGTASLLLDGAGDYVTTPDSDDWHFGVSAFTVEAFVRFNVVGAAAIVSKYNGDPLLAEWMFNYTGAGHLAFRFYDTAGTFRDTSAAWAPSAGVWYHVAATRDAAGDVRVYVDGVMIAKANFPQDMRNGVQQLWIGSNNHSSPVALNGWLDEVRITKGVARYASDVGFTPPAAAFAVSAGMPAPLATLGPNVEEYEDANVVAGSTYYYIVSAFTSLSERFSDEIMVVASVQPNTYGLRFVVAGPTTYVTSGTSISQILPQGIEAGDLLVLAMFGRSAVTPPAGYTLIQETPQFNPLPSNTDQRGRLYFKIAGASDAGASITFTQASANRMALHSMVFKPDGNSFALVDSASAIHLDVADDRVMPVPATAIVPSFETLGILAITFLYEGAGPAVLPDGYIMTTPVPGSDFRLMCAYKNVSRPDRAGGGLAGYSALDNVEQAFTGIAASFASNFS